MRKSEDTHPLEIGKRGSGQERKKVGERSTHRLESRETKSRKESK